MNERIGEPVRRKEDARLIIGKGTYSDDFNQPGQLYAQVVRSPHAHAHIKSIDSAEAALQPGVIAVFTGKDMEEDGLKAIPHVALPSSGLDISLVNRDGTPPNQAPQFVLPTDRVRHVGEAVAMVVGESVTAAKDGAERVLVDYETMPAVTVTMAALEPDAPILYDGWSSNLCIDADVGDKQAADTAFEGAAHVVKFETWIARVTGVPMEPRAAVGVYDEDTGRYTLYAGGGAVVRPKNELAGILGVEPDMVRVVAKDVGGNFGTRNSFFPEFAMMPWAAKRLGRPVKWTADRSEAFLSDYQGRDLHVEAELALDRDGNFIAMRGSNVSNIGAHTVSVVPLTKGVEIMCGPYRIPAIYFRARGVHSNTPPTNPYRSAGRPEVIFVMERMVDLAARECGFDPIQLRRRNMIKPDEMPYDNKLGMTYDSGTYEAAMDQCFGISDLDGFAARKADSAKRSLKRGLGISAYMETSTGAPRERTEMTVRPDGEIDVIIGTLSAGQGHETSFAQLLTEWLDVPIDCVNLITGDTDIVSVGGGTHSGRSMRLAGVVMGMATDIIIEKGQRIAGHVLEASENDIEFANGRFGIAGTDRSLDIFEIAKAAMERDDLPEDLAGELTGEGDFTQTKPAYPFGCHTCEVEVDTDTGQVAIVRYAGVDDVGRAINPLILAGQAHGGIVQGLGQALLESTAYDAETGQMLGGSFMDYAMPRAGDMPSFITEISEVPTPINPLGIRAGGEGGTTPALSALVNAIVDALAEFGVRHVEMPTTPEKVWRAIQDAKG
ncbi:MAG: xanthine dehydrogenase family protein molybdopterin-binding subunit [Rhodospirillaceae bacterium]|nr:xanthine dehydrogenase family protein molybdopterin-binding subunit [Rhodospirillaceae bacterium]MBT5840964.1 xanthine dehydrogenase family protein molybdopterin-binding subunit [Rhodospirillaceae bacterium]